MNSSPFEIPCVILSGGRSSRMGEDKSLLPFANSNTLTQYQYDRLKPYFKNIYISSKIDKFDFLDKKELLLDKSEVYSPIAALESIFTKLESEKVFIITVDTPLVTIESIEKMIEQSKATDITVAQTQRVHNLCGVFSQSCLKLINKMLEDDFHKVGFLLKNLSTKYIEFPKDEEFINLNRKEDYERAISIIR